MLYYILRIKKFMISFSFESQGLDLLFVRSSEK